MMLETRTVRGRTPNLDVAPVAHGLGRAVKAGGAPAAREFVRVAQAVAERWVLGWPPNTWAELSAAAGAWDDVEALRGAVAIVEQVRDALAAFVSSGGLHGRGVDGIVAGFENYTTFTVVLASLYHGLRARLGELGQTVAVTAEAAEAADKSAAA